MHRVAAALGVSSLVASCSASPTEIKGIKSQNQKTIIGYKAIDDFVKSGNTVGLGTGSTATYAMKRLAEKLNDKSLSDITVVPCSEEIKKKCIALQIPTRTLSQVDQVDIFIDSADEIDPMLNIVKGSYGSFLREKMAHNTAIKNVVIVDETKLTRRLGPGHPIPVEITPYSHEHTRRIIEALPSLTGVRAVLRRGSITNNFGDGADVAVTDNGNYIVDLYFEQFIADVSAAVEDLDATPGVVEHGIIPRCRSVFLVASEHGVRVLGDSREANLQPWWGEQPMKIPFDRLSLDNRQPDSTPKSHSQ